MYTIRLQSGVYALHAFQKKSTHGIATPQHDLDLLRHRLGWAQHIQAVRLAERGRQQREQGEKKDR